MIFGIIVIVKCIRLPSITTDGDEKSHITPIPLGPGFPGFIGFASAGITMNVTNDNMAELRASEED